MATQNTDEGYAMDPSSLNFAATAIYEQPLTNQEAAAEYLVEPMPGDECLSNEPSGISWVNWQESTAYMCCLWSGCDWKAIADGGDATEIDRHLEHHITSVYTNQNCVETPFYCEVATCDGMFTSAVEFRSHVATHAYHASIQLQGLLILQKRMEFNEIVSCGFPSRYASLFDGQPIWCQFDHCAYGFYDFAEFIRHVNEHVDRLDTVETDCADTKSRKVFKCGWSDCTLTFATRGYLREHMRHHSGSKQCACPFCGQFFATATRLMDHIYRKMPGDLVCGFCHKCFSDTRLLRVHCERHRATQQCAVCGVILKSDYDLKKHMARVHETRSREFRCDLCDRVLAGEEELKNHASVHQPPSFECSTCHRMFRWKKQLQFHEKKHQGAIADPYVCHICGVRYSTGTSLTRHLKSKHAVPVPAGFSRFQYKKCEDGLMRLLTSHLIAGALAESVLSGNVIC